VLDPCAVARVPCNRDYSLPELLQDTLMRGEPVGSFVLSRGWIDVGHFEQLRRAQGIEA
jgi:NDP-sugar pyrophosphorylase family protein